MKKILIMALLVSYVNAEIVGLQDAVIDGMLNGVTGLFKEVTGQNDQLHEENCQKEYKKLYERNSKQLKKEKEDNIKLRGLARVHHAKYEKMKINDMQIRRNGKCSTEYWDYFKATNHEISQISKENRHIKLLLSKKKINYAPLLKTTSISYVHKEESVTMSEREKAKADLKKQMGF